MTQARPAILFDISRLLMRAGHAVPTGIDRVELAYLEHLLEREADRTSFVFVLPGGLWGRVRRRTAEALVRLLASRWHVSAPDRPTHPSTRHRVVLAAATSAVLDAAGRFVRIRRRPRVHSVYLNVSHQQLDRPRTIGDILHWSRARFIAMIHDLIPLSYPEYGRPGQAERHRRRMATVLRLADGILTNSAATLAEFRATFAHSTIPARAVPLAVAPAIALATSSEFATRERGATAEPYFVCLGTIEPRKNHLTLLHAWRQMVQDGGAIPHLHIVGRRGWENEMVVDLLERCAPIHPYVHEHNTLPDTALRALLQGAQALLMPSFAEGYGLPLAEAMADGVPVVCSDLPAHREIGGDIPEYLNPLDSLAWIAAIRDYASPDPARRSAQLARLAGWQPPRWDTHMHSALEFVAWIESRSGPSARERAARQEPVGDRSAAPRPGSVPSYTR